MSKNLILLFEKFKENDELLEHLNSSDSMIFALDYHSHKQLTEMNIKHRILDADLTDSDLTEINDIILNISTKWYLNKIVEKELLFENINFGWLLEQELYPSLIQIITIFFSLIKIKNNFNPDCIFISNSLIKLIPSVFPNNSIKSIEDQNDVKEYWNFDVFSIKYNFGRIPITLRIPRRVFFKLRKYYEKLFIPFFNTIYSHSNKNNPSVVLVDFNPSLYQIFLKKLSFKTKNIFLLNRRRVAVWNLESFKTVKNNKCILGSYEHHIDKNDNDIINNQINIMKKKLKLLFSNDNLFSDLFSINGISFWNYFSEYFTNYCEDRFTEAIYEKIAAKNFLLKTKPSLIIHFYEVSLQEKILIHEARKQNISSIILQHGTPHVSFPGFPGLNSIHGTLPLNNDKKIALWGPIMQKYAIDQKIEENNLIISGSPRHDSFFKLKNNIFPDKGLILITLGQIDKKNAGSQLTNTYIQYEKAITLICNTLKNISDRKKIIKLHPGDMIWKSVIVEPLIKKIDPQIQIIVDGNLPKIIQSSSLIITVGLTTVLLEANILEKPTLTILSDPQERLSASSSGNTMFFNANEEERFKNTVNEILMKKEISKIFVNNGNDFIKKYLANPGNASEYLANIIDQNI